MDMTGEYRIPAPRQRVWEALNDPQVLKAAIPGCEELKKSPTELEAKVTAKVGPVSAKFGGEVTLSDLNPPESYTISGQGKGGAAGFAKGGATVMLAEDGADTILRYTAKAEVGGKLAQIGSRLIQGTARKMADEFFGKFSRIVAESYAAERLRPPPAAARHAAAPAAGRHAGRQQRRRTSGAVRVRGGAGQRRRHCPAPPPQPRPVAFPPERPPVATTRCPRPGEAGRRGGLARRDRPARSCCSGCSASRAAAGSIDGGGCGT